MKKVIILFLILGLCLLVYAKNDNNNNGNGNDKNKGDTYITNNYITNNNNNTFNNIINKSIENKLTLKDRYEGKINIRILDTKKTSTSIYYARDFNNENNGIGIEFTIKLGKNYSERKLEELEKRIEKLEKGNLHK